MVSAPLSLLYIDDDPGLARLVQKTLGRRGYTVATAATSEQGLACLAQGAVDVIALDHYLPTGTGLDFLEALQARAPAPPVVYVTASGETAVAVAALKAGAADYVSKSVGEEFFELLGRAIDQAVEKGRLERPRDRAELLLHEVNHRVANSLALVAAMVGMQANSVADPIAKSALAETQTRISAIANVHRRLYASDDIHSVEIAGYLANVLKELEATVTNPAAPAPQVRLMAQTIDVPTDKAISIGMIVTELVTNAFKYAYPDGRGEIRVRCDRTDAGGVHLAVEDDGIGWDGGGTPKGTGVGARIVAALARNLNAAVSYQGGGGCRVSLDFEI